MPNANTLSINFRHENLLAIGMGKYGKVSPCEAIRLLVSGEAWIGDVKRVYWASGPLSEGEGWSYCNTIQAGEGQPKGFLISAGAYGTMPVLSVGSL